MEIFGWLGTILFMICYLPQIYTTKRTKDVRSLSVPMWLIQWAAYTSCLVYSVLIYAEPLMFGYSMGWLLTAWELELARQYKDLYKEPKTGINGAYIIYTFPKRKI